MANYPDRIRLPRGKHIHAAKTIPASTACGTHFDINSARWYDETEPATCPKCLRELSR